MNRPERDSTGEVARAFVDIATQGEARWRSASANALVTVVALAVAMAPRVPGAHHVVGRITLAQATCVAALAWLVYEVAVVAHRVFGPRHVLGEVAAVADAFVRHAALLALVWFGGSASSPRPNGVRRGLPPRSL